MVFCTVSRILIVTALCLCRQLGYAQDTIESWKASDFFLPQSRSAFMPDHLVFYGSGTVEQIPDIAEWALTLGVMARAKLNIEVRLEAIERLRLGRYFGYSSSVLYSLRTDDNLGVALGATAGILANTEGFFPKQVVRTSLDGIATYKVSRDVNMHVQSGYLFYSDGVIKHIIPFSITGTYQLLNGFNLAFQALFHLPSEQFARNKAFVGITLHSSSFYCYISYYYYIQADYIHNDGVMLRLGLLL